jgi:hypothetical protein
MNADLDVAIFASAGVGGSIDPGKIKFFEVGIRGFDFLVLVIYFCELVWC